MVLPRSDTKHSIAFEFCRTSINCGEAARCLIDLSAVARSFSCRGSKLVSNSPLISSSFSHAFNSPGSQRGLYFEDENVRMTTVLEAKASRTLESACETCENRSKTLIALVVDSWAIPRLSSRRIDMIEEDSGSRIPSLTNILQKSLRGVGDYFLAVSCDMRSHSLEGQRLLQHPRAKKG
jgi:hypothetical protein